MTKAETYIRQRSRREILTLAGATLATGALTLPALAAYPERNIIAIVPFAPGGSNDIVARLYAPILSQKVGQPVVIENKPGAAGNIGIAAVVNGKPDGYTIVFSATASTQNPALFKTMPFDPLKDIVPVAQLAESPYVFFVKKDFPAKTLAEFLDVVRKNPGKFNAAAGGIGTRLSVELFNFQNNVKTTIVPYDGTGPASTALQTGEADFAIIDPTSFGSAVASGRVRALATAGESRLSMFPDVPTTTEAGLAGFTAGAPYGVYVKAGTPADIVAKLNAMLNEISAMPEIIERLRSLGLTPTSKTPEQFAALYRSEIEKWKGVVQKAGIPLIE